MVLIMGLIERNTLLDHEDCTGCGSLCDAIDSFFADFSELQLVVAGCPGHPYYYDSLNGTWTYGNTHSLVCGNVIIEDGNDDRKPLLVMWKVLYGHFIFGAQLGIGSLPGMAGVSHYGFGTVCEVLAALAVLRGGGTVALPLYFNNGCLGGETMDLSVP